MVILPLLQSLGNRESGVLQAFALTVATVIISRIIFHICGRLMEQNRKFMFTGAGVEKEYSNI